MHRDDVYYDYCMDVNPGYLDEQFDIFDTQKYIDPDGASARLYDALYKELFYDYGNMKSVAINCAQIIGQKYNGPLYYSIYIKNSIADNVEFLLSADYIGPSKIQAKNVAKLSDGDIKDIIRQARTLGGHIMWPRGKGSNTVNVIRGGEIEYGYGFYDRIDWTLLLLMQYYEVINYDNKNMRLQEYQNKITNLFPMQRISEDERKCFAALFRAFDVEKEWYGKFKTFHRFCDFFKLKGSFINEKYDVVELTSYFPMKPDKNGYIKYIENNLKAIDNRNSILLGNNP